MDLGAPILDVQATVVDSSSTKPATSVAKPTSIISGGVVTAPGFEPLTLTVSAAEPEVQGGIFIPDIPIMQVDTIEY